MSETVPSVNIGKIGLIAPAGDYNHYGATNVVNVREGGRYIEANAGSHNAVDHADALDKLHTHISSPAMHNSAARVDAPKCHPETRKAVQENILSWMSTGNGVASTTLQLAEGILWLTGPAGTGKTAIMGTVSDRLEEAGQLAGSFYFSSFKGMAETMSKRRFVATLAYQLVVHPTLRNRLSSPILAAVRQNPAIFDMSLKRQLEVLILEPLRSSQRHVPSTPGPPLSIVVDGVDECGEAGDSSRSKQDDQVEVLSLLLQAAHEPAFPFRIIVASRPETWIRTFFSDSVAGRFTEIFLDDRYSPDNDIHLFLKSKFAELCRRCGLDPAMWPSERAIAKLVEDASGQFIYAATVLRYIDTPGTIPQSQLDIVLKIKPRDTSNPFSLLDALYASILQSRPNPEMAVLWLKAVKHLHDTRNDYRPSAWTINRLLESHAGQAQTLLGGLPSLVHVLPRPPRNIEGYGMLPDSQHYGDQFDILPSPNQSFGWGSSYSFYHKSFLDYLGDRSRYGASFPGVDGNRFDEWIQERFAQTLKCGGPEAPVDSPLLLVFQRCLLDILVQFNMSVMDWRINDAILYGSEPAVWLNAAEQVTSSSYAKGASERVLYTVVHHNCRSYRPCNPGCKKWRRAISKLSNDRWREAKSCAPWGSFDILRDRFKIGCLRLG